MGFAQTEHAIVGRVGMEMPVKFPHAPTIATTTVNVLMASATVVPDLLEKIALCAHAHQTATTTANV